MAEVGELTGSVTVAQQRLTALTGEAWREWSDEMVGAAAFVLEAVKGALQDERLTLADLGVPCVRCFGRGWLHDLDHAPECWAAGDCQGCGGVPVQVACPACKPKPETLCDEEPW